MDKLKELYQSLQLRKRPEDIAEAVIEILKDDLSTLERSILDKAARGSLKRQVFGYSSMAQEFARAVGAERQIKKAVEIFKLENIAGVNYDYIPDIKGFIGKVSPLIQKEVGDNNFLSGRLDRAQRKAAGLDLSKRAYNKRWRLLKRLENKLLKYEREVKKVEFQKIAKHGIVHHLEYESFIKDKNTACFIAYFNARCNLRSVFTNQSQARAYDEVSDMLYKRCKGEYVVGKSLFGREKVGTRESNTEWLAMAHIYTGQEVLSHLTDEQKGRLLGKWTNILQEIATLLDEVWTRSSINLQTMIVRRGNDSTTWNNTAGAWNKARDQWMNVIYSMGMEFVLDEVCFGKVMRLMAADVAAWHRASGGKLDPNTEVWNKLPLPWEVFKGIRGCNKDLVVKYCHEAGIDAVKSGWIAPRQHGVEEFRPTPELVHGVEVASPFLASVLKRHRYFSGKNAKPFDPVNN
ncbi:hypothetical protein JMN32_24910 [Fulvivirga sp. 29W222]|uniref:Uncharacterized protein n=1 Tax=Fulvivirga marina TaxID=2494733 RepID=A0A937G0I7_9BACT|nr:hypothetical protein [Fulvivirga marina]MBL6449575.1 hypothetical protein [Fulvivirga marina]